ncbi:hypothetical protein Nepgr_012810 [Nepenthes gracilis]|uniref:Uncharacterized protein n=1 Tax=Nepenthes gracilis TaxID=150966 RepID=A0AAD3SHZ2_NEPGR|nr:hypothetical protein Nepgr_012810 [Nepenthes gracilis]
MAYNHNVDRSQWKKAPPETVVEEPVPIKNATGTVTNVYQACIAGFWRNVTVQWFKNFMNISFSITVDSIESESSQTCKVELKPWQFWGKKGYKFFEIDVGRHPWYDESPHKLEICWDFRSAKFFDSPEPYSNYYLALVSDEEIVVLLGDNKNKAFKRTKKRPALVDAVQSLKGEVVYAKKSFSTRARFEESRGEHDIVVESSTAGPRDPEMWISVDGIVLVHVKNLHWKFRGNETVIVNKLPIQVFWDVHAWLFSAPGTGYGLFVFKPGAAEAADESGQEVSGRRSDSGGSTFYSTRGQAKAPDFCLFLYAWKTE